jgi:Na+-translocating ferredoxin:NAD+ oxidoreductase subunit E
MEKGVCVSFYKEFIKGLWKENPVFRLVLGMCPTLAVSTSVSNGVGMGVAVTFVLVFSNAAISLVRNIVPSKVRIPCYIVIIATFVTVVDLLMNAFAHELHKSLGIFIPLIVVNCIILGRAEAFASKNSLWHSVADGLGMGLGFMLGLVVLAAFREMLGNGTLLGFSVGLNQPMLLMILPPGGFLALGCLLALMNNIQASMDHRRGKSFTPPAALNCRSCIICSGAKPGD